MRRRPPRSTRTDTLFPYTTLFRPLLPLLRVVAGSATFSVRAPILVPVVVALVVPSIATPPVAVLAPVTISIVAVITAPTSEKRGEETVLASFILGSRGGLSRRCRGWSIGWGWRRGWCCRGGRALRWRCRRSRARTRRRGWRCGRSRRWGGRRRGCRSWGRRRARRRRCRGSGRRRGRPRRRSEEHTSEITSH